MSLLDKEGAQVTASKELKPAQASLENALMWNVENDETMGATVSLIQTLMRRDDEMQTVIDEKVKPAEDAIKELKAVFKEPQRLVKDAIVVLKEKAGEYWENADDRRTEDQRKLAIQSEKRKKQLIKRAEQARNKGDYEKAANLEGEAVGLLAPIVPDVFKPDGFSVRTAWEGIVVDKLTIIRQVADGLLDPSILTVDKKALNALASSNRGTTNVDGITFRKKRTTVVRRAGGD